MREATHEKLKGGSGRSTERPLILVPGLRTEERETHDSAHGFAVGSRQESRLGKYEVEETVAGPDVKVIVIGETLSPNLPPHWTLEEGK